ncbi:hypothetical protein HZC07_06005 [Candidatus Micrarchaeota archaeon]|nr:hypothetical protein [Candidatus Micrarchaeota archaeon]
MKAIVNASPLIFLAKLGKLHLLFDLFEEVFTTSSVLEEVFEGLTTGYPDALVVKKSADDGTLKTLTVSKHLDFENLGEGALSVIEAALEHKIGLVVLDDFAAIKTAKYFSLEVISTPFLLLKLLEKKKITKKEFVSSFNALMDFDYRISPVLYKRILDVAEKL